MTSTNDVSLKESFLHALPISVAIFISFSIMLYFLDVPELSVFTSIFVSGLVSTFVLALYTGVGYIIDLIVDKVVNR